MAYLTLDRDKLASNHRRLHDIFHEANIAWDVVTKLLCGNELYVREILALGVTQVADSRLSNLKLIKAIDPTVSTVYIKPPAWDAIDDLVRWADISCNTEYETLKRISDAARSAGITHRVIIMVEMGDLREGVLRDDLVDFHQRVHELPGIEVIGLGTNFNCLSGVMPHEDKLFQLGLFRTILEQTTGHQLPWISAGTTVTLPLLQSGRLPDCVNHFRIGEALFFGGDLANDVHLDGMHDDVLTLHAQVIELSEKPVVPSGDLGKNPFGAEAENTQAAAAGETTHRAILDVGFLDCSPQYLILDDPDLGVIDASSDMLVLDAGPQKGNLSIGDHIEFKLKYMGALHLMNSAYIEKRVVDAEGNVLASAPAGLPDPANIDEGDPDS